MAVSLPPPNPQKGCETLPVGVVASGEYQPHAQASLLPAALRDGLEDSPEKNTILAAQAGKAHHHNQQGLGQNTSKRGGYGFHQGEDTKHPSLGIAKPNNVADNNHEPSSASSPAPCDKKRGKVDDVQGVIAAPTRPASTRKRSNNGLRELRLSVGGKLSKLFGFGGGGGRESPPPGSPREAAVALLPWESHENLSKTLNYRPRGHGRAFLDSYEVGAVLGSGGFAVVLEGIYKADGEPCAVKVINRKSLANTDALAQEVVILRSLGHAQVVRFLDFYEEPTRYFLVIERVLGGELFDRIGLAGRFREGDARACVRSLLEALAYCHSQKIVHRDIKPENILMASRDVNDSTIKLADFGLAASVASRPAGSPPCGTPTYMAPERLMLAPHSTPVDCWSAGVVTYILLGGYPPFSSPRMEKLFRLIKRARVNFDNDCWGAVSEAGKDFTLALLKLDPMARLTAEEALRHRWLDQPDDKTARGSHEDLSLSLAQLRVFNAKKKLRRAIVTFMACQNFRWLTSPTTGGLGDISLREDVEGDQSSEGVDTIADADIEPPPTFTIHPPEGGSPDPAGIKAPLRGFLPDIVSPALGEAPCTSGRGDAREGGDVRAIGGIALLSAAAAEADISSSSGSSGGGGNGTGGSRISGVGGVDDAAETLADLGRPQERRRRHEPRAPPPLAVSRQSTGYSVEHDRTKKASLRPAELVGNHNSALNGLGEDEEEEEQEGEEEEEEDEVDTRRRRID